MNTGKQAAIHSCGSVVLMFSQWLISVLLVRMDGYEAAGIFSLALSMSNIFSAFAFYNFRNYRVTDINGEFTQRQYLTASLITVILSFLAFAVYIVTAKGYTMEERAAIGLYLLYVNCNCAAEVIYAYVQFKGRLELNGYSNIIRGFVVFAFFMVTFLITHHLLLSILLMAAGNMLVVLLFDLRAYTRITGERIAFFGDSFQGVIELLKKCFPLMLAIVLPIIITAMPRRAIQKLLGEEQLGYFSSAFTVTVLISTVAPSISYAFLPGIADKLNRRDRRGTFRSVAWIYVGVILFMLLALVVAAVLGRPVMRLIFGEEILQYFDLVYWSIAASSFYALSFVGTGILTTMRKGATVMWAILAALVAMMLLVDRFVGGYGIYGGAYVMMIVYLLQDVIQIAGIAGRIAGLKELP